MLNGFLAQMSIGVIIKPYCLHNYLLQASTKPSSSFTNDFNLFKHSKLLIQNYVQIYSGSIACILVFIICESTLALYTCLVLGSHLPWSKRLIFGNTAVNLSSCVILIYTTLAEIHELSVKLLETIQVNHKIQHGKHENGKILSAYTAPKVSFVTLSTPIESQHMIIDQTVNLALLN